MKAVAIDFGASSGRFALGELTEERISFEIVERVKHEPREQDGHLVWDMDAILGLCRRALEFAEREGALTIGIDTWGVDLGFLDENGRLVAPVVCYRDWSHQRAFEERADLRGQLYRSTGVQHQPFNTFYQLLARLGEERATPSWLMLPDLLGYLLGAPPGYELTACSTSQLLGLEGKWHRGVFDLLGIPPPEHQPVLSGVTTSIRGSSVRLARIGGHDTASAVCGMGILEQNQAFLNVGTWSLLGRLLEEPIATPEAERANFTNERAVDGRVRFLKNIPGFYVVNRLHEELGVESSVPEWLDSADPNFSDSADLFRPELFNPDSMTAALLDELKPRDLSAWAALALNSMARAVAAALEEMVFLSSSSITSVRVAGGGSESGALCQRIADFTRMPVHAGPQEATILGNLAVQFLASGGVGTHAEVADLVGRSSQTKTYRPQ